MKEFKENIPKKRVALKVFGIILISLGMINIMFFTKAGIELPKFYIFIIIAGAVIFIVELLRGQR